MSEPEIELPRSRVDEGLDDFHVPRLRLALIRLNVLLLGALTRLGDLVVLLMRPRLLKPYLGVWWKEWVRSPYYFRRSFETVRVLRASGQMMRELVYGETPVFTAVYLFRRAGLGPGGRLVDVGAGRGRPLLAARWLGAQVRGVELLREHVEAVEHWLRPAGIELVVGDAARQDYGDATHVYLPWTCLGPQLRQRLVERFRASCRPGTRFLAISQPVEGEDFITLARYQVLFTWGLVPVWLQEWRPPTAAPAAAP